MLCAKLSIDIICTTCLQNLWHIHSQRELTDFKIFSTFAFSELKDLLSSKNNIIGSRIIQRLGIYGVRKFFEKYPELLDLDKQNTAVICVRNKRVGMYSHSAILAHCFKKYGFKIFYNRLIIGNESRFALLKRKQREEIGRNFRFYPHKKFDSLILVDDIITTGQTFLEAITIIKEYNCTPLYGWTLCDSRY